MFTNILSGGDMLIVLVVVMLVFGPKNLPKLARSIGSSVQELKKGLNGEGAAEEDKAPGAAPAAPAAPAAKPGDPTTPEHH